MSDSDRVSHTCLSAWSIDELSGRSPALPADSDLRGLRAMPLERRRSRHSLAYLPLLPPPGTDISDDYGPAGSCWRIDLAAAGARATRMSLLWAELTDEGRSDTALHDRRPTRPLGAG